MPLVDMKDMLQHAYRHGYAVGAFDFVSLDFLEGIMMAAENARAPVILNLVESHFSSTDIELLIPAVEAAAARALVPVAIHLDHSASIDNAVKAINRSCNGVKVDAAHMDFTENTQLTKTMVETAHACGVAVEGELGCVPGADGENAERHPGDITYTSLAEAKAYVERTGVDFLAIAIGTMHGDVKGKPKLDYQRLKQINEKLAIPLVIHGGTGLSDDQYRRLIANGVDQNKLLHRTVKSGGEKNQRKHQGRQRLCLHRPAERHQPRGRRRSRTLHAHVGFGWSRRRSAGAV